MWIAEQDGLKLTIDFDLDSVSPRNWHNDSHMVYWPRSHKLGDRHNYKTPAQFAAALVDEFVRDDELNDGLVEVLISDDEFMRWTNYGKRPFSSAPERNILEELCRDDVDKEYLKRTLTDEMPAELVMRALQKLGKIAYRSIHLYHDNGRRVSTVSRYDSRLIGWIYAPFNDAVDIDEQLYGLKLQVETYDDYLRGACYQYTLERDGAVVSRMTGLYGDFDDVLYMTKSLVPNEYRDIVNIFVEAWQ